MKFSCKSTYIKYDEDITTILVGYKTHLPALAALSGHLLVLVVELSEELGGFLLVPPHQLLQLLKLPALLLLVNLRLLQTLQGAHWDIWCQSDQAAYFIRPQMYFSSVFC